MTADFDTNRIDLAQEGDFRLGKILARPSIRQVEAEGESQTLQPRIMQVLVALARRRGQVVSRDELIRICWEGRAVGEDAINRCIQQIRKLGEANGAFEVETIPRVGYRLSPEDGPAPGPSGKAGEPPSIAVLPFSNRSGLPDDEVFAEGMAEDVINVLSQGVHFRVLGSVVTAGLRRTAEFDFPALGRQLGVGYLLDGNVRRAGENLQVSAQLVDAASGQVVWSGRFDRPLSELAALQEELVLELAGSLGAEIHVLDMQNVLRKPGDITAWEACVRVMAALRQIDPMSLARAVQDAQNAVDIAPDYPVGHGLLAAVSGLRYFVMSPDDQAEVRRIRKLAEQALQIGQDNPFVVANAGGALMTIGHPEEGLGPLLRALRKAPALGPAHYMTGWCYLLLNRTDEAQRHLNEALRLLPAPYMAAYIKEWQANVAIRRGRWDEAEELIEEVIALAPMHMTALVLKAVLAWLGQRREAARVLFAPLRHGGFLELDQLLTLFRRGHATSPAHDDILAAIRALWTETSAAGGAS